MSIDGATGDDRIKAAHVEYLRSWSQSADSIDQQGGYRWMAEQVLHENPLTLLDIGCGLGHGLAALLALRKDLDVIALDENPQCLIATEKRLQALGVEVERIERIRHKSTSEQTHMIDFRPGTIRRSKQVTLIESDAMLNDAEARMFLGQRPFDAATIWLIGTHKGRQECDNLESLRIRTSQEYRLHVQNPMYQFAGEILRPGGILNVVDRGEYPDTKQKEEWTLDPHREQAGPTSLRVENLATFPYTELTGAGVPMGMSMPIDGRKPGPQLALNSVTSRKLASV